MDLQINRQSQLPIHVQLKAQLTHMIQAGQLRPGTQLPTVRQLAGFLRINRNTAARVFADLEREGYLVCETGRGTFVAKTAGGTRGLSPRFGALAKLVDETLVRAEQLGFSPPEFAAALYTYAQSKPPTSAPKPRALFTECNRFHLQKFSRELEEAVPIHVETLLTTELARKLRTSPGFLRPYAVVVTTFWHIHEVQTLLRKTKVEVVGLLAEASLETLLRLTALPAGTKVGVACGEWTGTENARRSIENAGLRNIQLVAACGAERAKLQTMLKGVRVVVCSSLVAKTVQALAPKGVEVIVDDHTLNKGGLEMLRQRLARRATPETSDGGQRRGAARRPQP